MNEPKAATGPDLDDALNRLEKKVNREEQQDGSRLGVGTIVALLLACIALGGAAYSVFVGYQQQLTVTSTSNSTRTVERSIEQTEKKLDAIEQQVKSLQLTQSTDTEQLQSQLERIHHQITSIERNNSREWTYAEVEYLLKLANQRVLIEKDAGTAIGLLRSADEILERSEGTAAFALRDVIANDMAKLKAVGEFDLDGLFLKLGALINQVEKLKQKRKSYHAKEVVTLPDQANDRIEDSQSWTDRIAFFVGKFQSRLSELVDFRSGTERVHPILPPTEEYYLRQNLILKLELAQRALIKGSQTVFDYNVQESIRWIDMYFESSDPLTQSMSTTLKQVQEVRVERQLPDISSSLIAIREVILGSIGSSQPEEQKPIADGFHE